MVIYGLKTLDVLCILRWWVQPGETCCRELSLEPFMGKQVFQEIILSEKTGTLFFSVLTAEWERRMKHERHCNMTTLSHVKIERCVLKVQVMVRLLLTSVRGKYLRWAFKAMQHDWLLQKFFNIVPFREDDDSLTHTYCFFGYACC